MRRHAVAYLALFVALGGTSYAAATLPANSVGTKQLKQHAVTLSKVDKDARKALRGNRGPRGVRGPAGPGARRFWVDQNVNLDAGVVYRSKDFAVDVHCAGPLSPQYISITREAPANVAVNGSYVYGEKNQSTTATYTVSKFLDGGSGGIGAQIADSGGSGGVGSGTVTVQSYLPGRDTAHEYTVVATIADEGGGKCAAYGSVTPAS